MTSSVVVARRRIVDSASRVVPRKADSPRLKAAKPAPPATTAAAGWSLSCSGRRSVSGEVAGVLGAGVLGDAASVIVEMPQRGAALQGAPEQPARALKAEGCLRASVLHDASPRVLSFASWLIRPVRRLANVGFSSKSHNFEPTSEKRRGLSSPEPFSNYPKIGSQPTRSRVWAPGVLRIASTA